MTEQNAAVGETPAPSEAEAMMALYDKLTSEGVEDEPQAEEVTDGLREEEEAEGLTEEAEGKPEEGEEAKPEAKAQDKAAEAQEQPVEAPTDLPSTIRAKWADMPQDARDAVLSSHRELTRKMAEQGRVVQASKPVYDVLVEAAQKIPTMQNMTPAQIAQDVFRMAQIQGELNARPVETLLNIAKQYGAVEGIKQALAGQGQNAAAQENVALMQEIRQLRAQLQNAANPEAIDQRINQTLTVRDTERMVMEYATQKEYWGEVEPIMPQFIPIAQQRLGEQASAMDVLNAAYDMAIHAIPDLRTKVSAPAPAQAQPDPKRTEAQLKAKSVNVKPSGPTNPKPMSERQAMLAVYDRLTNQ